MKLRVVRTVLPVPIPGGGGAGMRTHFEASADLSLTFEQGLVTIRTTKDAPGNEDVIVPVSGGVAFMRPAREGAKGK